MKKFLLLLTILACVFSGLDLYSQAAEEGAEKPPMQGAAEDKAASSPSEKAQSFNIDALAAYGLYNRFIADFSIMHDVKNFSYQLNGDFKRINDFGYSNSSNYDAGIGFTAKADFSETWKFLPNIQMKNGSRGMFSNPVYSREENDILIFDLKNEYKPVPSRFDFNVGGGEYVHRLITSSGVERATFFLVSPEIGWEYLWSASNKLRLDSKFFYYYYENISINDDFNWSTEFVGSFKLFEYLKVNIGPLFVWNKDAGPFISGRANLASEGLKYTSLEISYSYDLIQFRPEDIYFKQKFIEPQFTLPPDAVHHADVKAEFDLKFQSKEKAFFERLKLKLLGVFENNSNFYNFYTVPGKGLLQIDPIPVSQFKAKMDISFDIRIYSPILRFGAEYEFNYYISDKYITYKPLHKAGAYIKLESQRVDFEYRNSFQDSVYISLDGGQTLGWFITGSVSMQVKTVDSFYLYAKVDNIYNSSIRYRLEYPDPGVTFVAGVRVIL